MTPSERSRRTLLQIAQQASTLAERLERGSVPPGDEGDPVVVQRRLDEWCRAAAKGDWDTFRKRLAWDGLGPDMVRAALGPQPLRAGEPLPAWADTLRQALTLAAGNEAGASAPRGECFRDPEQPLPFEELLVPFVLVARRRLAAQAGAGRGLLSEAAHAALERSLLQVLTSYAAPSLHLEFSLVRAREQSSLDRVLTFEHDDDNRALYDGFVRRMRRGGLLAFFREYAVLARLLATITDRWAEANAELLGRLEADLPELQRVFGGDQELGPVTAVRPALSDPHRGRRSVVALAFASGRELVYKPKDLGIEAAYHRLLAWLNERGAPLAFRVLAVLNRSTHGWVEFVEQRPCGDTEEAHRYYRRAGMLLCLAYALEATDCHMDNLIASGEHPVLVDLETLAHHRVRQEDPGDGARAEILAHEQLAYSVLRTGLLPVWQLGNGGRVAYDVSGLGGLGEQETPFRVPRWERVNTDRMALAYEPGRTRPRANVPLLDDVPVCLDEHADELVDGFRQMYRFLVACRAALLAPDSPLHGLAHQQVRFVHRPSRVYALLFAKLLDPRYLRDGADRSIQLELLSRAVVPSEERPRWWPLVAAEQRALEHADIPFFTAPTSSDGLEVLPGRTIEACFAEPSFDLVLARLTALDEEDLERQVAFTEGVLYAHGARDARGAPAADVAPVSADTAEPPSTERLLARAMAIAGELRTRAIRAPDGSAAWIGPQYLAQAERFQFQPLGHDLYGGACGVAVFLAAAAKIAGRAGYRELALGAVQPLRRELRTRGDRLARDVGIGGAAGLGGVVYALTRMADLVDDSSLLEDAKQIALLITAERIAADTSLDVIDGSAGAILGLCALYDVTGDQEVAERAMACGGHLLTARTASGAVYRAWATVDGKLLAGFSHGAAGIAYALLRLYELTRDPALLQAAREAIAYERSVFSPEAGNWPDFRPDDEPAFLTRWCHGAAGIGLARLGGLAVLDTPEIRRDIDIALETTRRHGLERVDHLCCGNLGRAEVLLAAGLRLSRRDLREAAEARAAQAVTGAEQAGPVSLHPLPPGGVYSPGFFQGEAGIGYELLRLAHPDVLPSVLLWE